MRVKCNAGGDIEEFKQCIGRCSHSIIHEKTDTCEFSYCIGIRKDTGCIEVDEKRFLLANVQLLKQNV